MLLWDSSRNRSTLVHAVKYADDVTIYRLRSDASAVVSSGLAFLILIVSQMPKANPTIPVHIKMQSFPTKVANVAESLTNTATVHKSFTNNLGITTNCNLCWSDLIASFFTNSRRLSLPFNLGKRFVLACVIPTWLYFLPVMLNRNHPTQKVIPSIIFYRWISAKTCNGFHWISPPKSVSVLRVEFVRTHTIQRTRTKWLRFSVHMHAADTKRFTYVPLHIGAQIAHTCTSSVQPYWHSWQTYTAPSLLLVSEIQKFFIFHFPHTFPTRLCLAVHVSLKYSHSWGLKAVAWFDSTFPCVYSLISQRAELLVAAWFSVFIILSHN